MAKDIKEYGTDLMKQYRELEKKQNTLRNKIVKRAKFLVKNSDSPYCKGFNDSRIDATSTETLLFLIIRVDEEYTKKTKQTEMFKTK